MYKQRILKAYAEYRADRLNQKHIVVRTFTLREIRRLIADGTGSEMFRIYTVGDGRVLYPVHEIPDAQLNTPFQVRMTEIAAYTYRPYVASQGDARYSYYEPPVTVPARSVVANPDISVLLKKILTRCKSKAALPYAVSARGFWLFLREVRKDLATAWNACVRRMWSITEFSARKLAQKHARAIAASALPWNARRVFRQEFAQHGRNMQAVFRSVRWRRHYVELHHT